MPGAVEEMLRYVTPVMHCSHGDRRRWIDAIGNQKIKEGDKVVFWHISANRDEDDLRESRHASTSVGIAQSTHIAFGGGGPHFCLERIWLASEIMVMFDRLLDRLPRHPPRRRGAATAVEFSSTARSTSRSACASAPVGGTPSSRGLLSRQPSRPRGAISTRPSQLPAEADQRGIPLGVKRSDVARLRGRLPVSTIMFNPRSSSCATPYSVREDGAPSWEKETALARSRDA